jgi:hypothetical protein
MLQIVHSPPQGSGEALRHFVESPKCPRKVRPANISGFVEEMAASEVKLQISCAVVVNKPT